MAASHRNATEAKVGEQGPEQGPGAGGQGPVRERVLGAKRACLRGGTSDFVLFGLGLTLASSENTLRSMSGVAAAGADGDAQFTQPSDVVANKTLCS